MNINTIPVLAQSGMIYRIEAISVLCFEFLRYPLALLKTLFFLINKIWFSWMEIFINSSTKSTNVIEHKLCAYMFQDHYQAYFRCWMNFLICWMNFLICCYSPPTPTHTHIQIRASGQSKFVFLISWESYENLYYYRQFRKWGLKWKGEKFAIINKILVRKKFERKWLSDANIPINHRNSKMYYCQWVGRNKIVKTRKGWITLTYNFKVWFYE